MQTMLGKNKGFIHFTRLPVGKPDQRNWATAAARDRNSGDR